MSSTEIRVRRIGQRQLGLGLALSSEPAHREMQLKLIGIFGGIVFLFLLLVVQKMRSLFGPLLVDSLTGVGLLGTVATVFLLVRNHQRALQVEPKDVEEKLVLADVIARLRAGRLSPSDLVFENGRWSTFIESVQFFELAEPAQRQAERRQKLRLAVAIIFGIAASLSLLLLFLNLGQIFWWLSDS